MKLDLLSSEVLALYNLLQTVELPEGHTDEVSLHGVKEMLRDAIIGALDVQEAAATRDAALDDFYAWQDGQETKLAELNEELERARAEARALAADQKNSGVDQVNGDTFTPSLDIAKHSKSKSRRNKR